MEKNQLPIVIFNSKLLNPEGTIWFHQTWLENSPAIGTDHWQTSTGFHVSGCILRFLNEGSLGTCFAEDPIRAVSWSQHDRVWLVVWTPLKNMKVNWDDDIPNIWENKKWQPNHQPGVLGRHPGRCVGVPDGVAGLNFLCSLYLTDRSSTWDEASREFAAIP